MFEENSTPVYSPGAYGKSKKIIIIAIIAMALIALTWAFVSKTSGEIASLFLSPSSPTVTAGANFNVAINVNTKNNNVVAVKSVVNYNPAEFQLVSHSTANSVFSSGNTCVYNSKPCEIISNEAVSGKITITLAKPSPGVNTASGLIANLTFKPLKALTPSANNITLHYIAFNDYGDSDVIFDDKKGTDILSEVFGSKITSVLPIPSGLSGTGTSATQTNLTWNNPASSVGITGYKIFRNNVQVGASPTNSFSDAGLAPKTSYAYKISAYDASGHESSQSSVVSVLTLADTTKPTVPEGLSSGEITMSEINLNWGASTDNVSVTGYNIYRNGNKVGTSDTTTCHDSGLVPETTYTYKISAYDAAGNESGQSTSIAPKTSSDSQAPTAPNNVNAQAVSMTQINLTWNASTDNVAVAGYNIHRNGNKIGTSTSTSYNDTGLSASTSYTYKISAYDAKNNESAESSSAQATTNSDTQKPTVPAGLTATPISMTEIDLSWSASADNVGAAGYKIFRNGTQIGTATTVSYKDSGLVKSTSYSYAVVSYDAAGNQSAQTPAVVAATLADTQKPTVPGNLTATPVSMSEINLSWSASTDNTGIAGYNVYRNGEKIKTMEEITFKDSGLVQNTAYRYSVSAIDGDGNESDQTAEVLATTPERKYTLVDFTNLVADWLKADPASPADVSGDGEINTQDLGIMMSHWH